MLDTARTFETPEGIDLEQRLAGPVVRAQAWLIDLGIRIVLYIVIGIALRFMGNFGQGIWLIIIFVMEWFYPVIFEVLKNGATPGKKRMKIKVTQDNGTPISWSASILRNLLRTVDFMPFLYGFGLCAMLINRDFKRLGDLAAGTLVIHSAQNYDAPTLPDYSPLSPPLQLGLNEQRAVLEFSERSQRLSRERCIELAEILTPVTEQQGDEAVKQLHRYANWLQGRT